MWSLSKRIATPRLAALIALALGAPASAQSYPTRPVKVIVPFPAGGFTDVGARIVAQKLAEVLGQPMVIENRAGASGTLGVAEAVKSAPDGYTLLMTTGDFVTVTSLMPKMAFDPLTALIPVTRFVNVPLLLLTNPNSGIGSVRELIEKAKAAPPGQYAYGSPGPGTINQLAAEWFALEAGIKLQHIPYKGGAQMATGLSAGEIPLAVTTQGSVQGLLDAGKIKALAVLTRERPSFMRQMPSMAESNLSVDAGLNIGLYVPAGTPAAIVSQLDAAVLRVLRDEAIRKRFNELGMDVTPVSGAALLERIRADAGRYRRVIEQTGVKLN
jgi:tripartite-type tricarboxylate transporter receptor subunit TctC